MKITAGPKFIYDSDDTLFELYTPWRRVQGLERKLKKSRVKLPEKIKMLNKPGYSLGKLRFMKKYPHDYAELQWAVARGNLEQIKEEWNKKYENTPYADKYKEFALTSRFYYYCLFKRIGFKHYDTEKTVRIMDILNSS